MLRTLATWAKQFLRDLFDQIPPTLAQEIPDDLLTTITNPQQHVLNVTNGLMQGRLPTAMDLALLVGAVAIALIARHLQATQVASTGAAPQNA